MKKTTEYNVEIETTSGNVYDFYISLTKKELNKLEAKMEEVQGNFYIGAFKSVTLECDRYTARDIIDGWIERMTSCTFSLCSDCGEYVPDSEGCCGSNSDYAADYEDDYDDDDDY